MLQALERRERRLLLGVEAVFYFKRYGRHRYGWSSLVSIPPGMLAGTKRPCVVIGLVGRCL